MRKALASEGPALFSPAVIASGKLVFVSGQVGSDPVTKQTPPDVESQTRICIERLKAILEQAGASLEDVVRANVYLTDMADFAKMNGVYRTFFPSEPPTRVTVGVSALAAPEFLVEIDVVAVID